LLQVVLKAKIARFQVVLGAFDFEEKLYEAKIINTL
jgi:hypothetical protein